MPTLNRRLQIAPTDRMWEVIDRFHEVTGQPRSKLVIEFMEPVFEQMGSIVDILEKVRDLKGEALEDVRNVSEAALERLEKVAIESAEHLAAIDRAAAKQPPACNTGVTNAQVIENIKTGRAA